MNPPRPPRLPFEMLHRVGDIDISSVNPHNLQRLIEDFSGRSNERFARAIFLVPRLLADKHDGCRRWPLPKHRLRRVFIK